MVLAQKAKYTLNKYKQQTETEAGVCNNKQLCTRFQLPHPHTQRPHSRLGLIQCMNAGRRRHSQTHACLKRNNGSRLCHYCPLEPMADKPHICKEATAQHTACSNSAYLKLTSMILFVILFGAIFCIVTPGLAMFNA